MIDVGDDDEYDDDGEDTTHLLCIVQLLFTGTFFPSWTSTGTARSAFKNFVRVWFALGMEVGSGFGFRSTRRMPDRLDLRIIDFLWYGNFKKTLPNSGE